MFGERPTKPRYVVVCVLLLAHAALLMWSASRHSPAIDEWAHLPSGILHWRTGRFDFYRVNPPLVRLIATTPWLFRSVDIASAAPAAYGTYRSELSPTIEFMQRYGSDAFPMFTIARWICIPFSLLGGITCYLWARELFGEASGLAACLIWCVSPNVIAHGQLITPDIAATSIGFASCYVFRSWMRKSTWSQTVLLGIMLGLALTTKFTWVILIPLWVGTVALAHWARIFRVGVGMPTRPRWVRLSLSFAIALAWINVTYCFDSTNKPLGDYGFISATMRGSTSADGRPHYSRVAGNMIGNRFTNSWLSRIPVPLPEQYLLGIDRQKADFEGKMWSYLRGEWRIGGWWYYYLYAMGVKIPLGTLGLLLIGLAILPWLSRQVRCDLLIYTVAPAAAIVALVSSQTGFNHHLRYVLPAFPYLFVIASATFSRNSWRRRWVTNRVGVVLLIWTLVSSIGTYPHSLSYFNELVGGPTKGRRHLLNSNIDWGQDLIFLRKWLDDQGEVSPNGIQLTMNLPARLVGLTCPHPPSRPTPGTFVVSVDVPLSIDGRLAYFNHLSPSDRIGYSIHIYRVTPEQAGHLRRTLRRERPLVRSSGGFRARATP